MNLECSRLGIIWYQDTLAYPIDGGVALEIKKLNWDELSYDDYL